MLDFFLYYVDPDTNSVTVDVCRRVLSLVFRVLGMGFRV